MSKRVVYTSVFGGYDKLVEQNLSDGWDWKCFSEENSLSLYTDNNRNAKRFKVLPHRYLQDYEYSIFIDGNITVRGKIDELIDKYLSDSNVAFFSHSQNKLDSTNCIYDEVNSIFRLGNRNTTECAKPEKTVFDCDGRCRENDPYHHYKDNAEIIKKQVEKYSMVGYPKNNGLIIGMIILRRHNEDDCIKTMEDWWTEIKYNSKRDQLSFNYVAWKNKLKFNYMDGDSRNNEYFINMGPHFGKVEKIKRIQNSIRR